MRILVGLSSCGIAAGAQEIYDRLSELDGILLEPTGCAGMCYAEPTIKIIDGDSEYVYGNLTPDDAVAIIQSHQGNKGAVKDKLAPLRQKIHEIVLRNCGKINPEKIADYIEQDGYAALKKTLKEYSPEEIIETIKAAGLRGRGGAGFPAGLKWQFARAAAGTPKYLICNADEGDPGAFMDRSVLEGDPHAVLEGMALAAYAIGASSGYIYCRAEYPLAIKRLRIAIAAAEENNYLGDNILASGFSFKIKIKEGAGAFVCGEETALMASIEGKRGMPRKRPPYPAVSGLYGKPTNINNVETLANVAWIVHNGADRYAALGTEKSKGTKVFALAGKVKNVGLIEVPMGTTLDEVVNDIGGGTLDGSPYKAVQLGGPSGGCIPAALGSTAIDYDSLSATGAIMGSGGMVVMDRTTCMVDVAAYFLKFTQDESCGKCTFCRIGTRSMLEILERITKGAGRDDDIARLRELCGMIMANSLCALGQTAPNPVLTTLKYFMNEFEEHIKNHKCPAGVCRQSTATGQWLSRRVVASIRARRFRR